MARRLLIALAPLALVGAASPTPQTLQGSALGGQLQFNRVPLNVVADTVLRRVSTRPFLLCDTVLNDKRLVSVRLEAYQLRYSVVAQILGAYGYSLRDRGGLLHVCGTSDAGPVARSGRVDADGAVRPVAFQAGAVRSGVADGGLPAGVAGSPSLPLGSPLDPGLKPIMGFKDAPTSSAAIGATVPHVLTALEAYRPDYVSPSALKEALAPLLPELKFSVVDAPGERPVLFARGDAEGVAHFKEAVAYLDTPADAVEVQAIVLEVTDSHKSGFGVSVVLDALKSTVGINLAGGVADNSLSFHSGSFDAVLSAVSGKSNVRVVSSPRLLGRSGETLRLQVGQTVPTLGAVVESPLGSSQQSVQYRPSGTIFSVLPKSYGRRLSLDLHQEVSAFAETETGVQGSPTLTTREIDTKVDLDSGDWVVVGGLSGSQTSNTTSGLFGLTLGKSKQVQTSELVLLVTARRLAGSSHRPLSADGKAALDAVARN
jgi:hypothetical protein